MARQYNQDRRHRWHVICHNLVGLYNGFLAENRYAHVNGTEPVYQLHREDDSTFPAFEKMRMKPELVAA